MYKTLFLFLVMMAGMFGVSSVGAQTQPTVEFNELTFFENAGDVEVTPAPVYITEFPQSTTRYIYFHVTVRNLLYGIRSNTPDVVGKLYKEDGTALGVKSAGVQLGPDLDYVYLSNGWGQNDPGSWIPGTYRVDVQINGVKVAEKKFTVYADN